VDPERCIGSGQCVLTAPEVFDQDDATGTVVLLEPAPRDALAERVREAAILCPAQVIAVHDA
jgi:ferredoxin